MDILCPGTSCCRAWQHSGVGKYLSAVSLGTDCMEFLCNACGMFRVHAARTRCQEAEVFWSLPSDPRSNDRPLAGKTDRCAGSYGTDRRNGYNILCCDSASFSSFSRSPLHPSADTWRLPVRLWNTFVTFPVPSSSPLPSPLRLRQLPLRLLCCQYLW